MNLNDYIANVPNFPKEGIQFKDVTPILNDKDAYEYTVNELAKKALELGANVIVAPESRGYLFGCPIAYKLNIRFVPVRKPNKLPRETISESYSLEYGTNTVSIHVDSLNENDKVFIVDDLLATGGTVLATCKLCERLKAKVVGIGAVILLKDLPAQEILSNYNITSLIEY